MYAMSFNEIDEVSVCIGISINISFHAPVLVLRTYLH